MARKLCSTIVLLVFLFVQAIPAECCSVLPVTTPDLVKIEYPVLSESGYSPHYASQSYLAGIGIRSSLQAGLSSNMDPGKIWQSVTTGLLQGVTSIGINYATQELGLPPLLANIGFSAISTFLNAGIQSLMPGGEKDVFKTVFETYENNVLTFLGYGDSPWLQAAYSLS